MKSRKVLNSDQLIKKNNIRLLYYSVMQSDGNSYCGNVVLNSFNKESRNEDNILDQIYKSKYFRIIFMMFYILYNIILT